ncbi:hypothetical protein CSKR_107431 [Clonorchis sinensis]|uniref:Uncharacterized protein n=1 Tax=Clonorchis sinensis TaxID=79923 RepID=A0A419PYT7_CLOSI|nr:hypothetical protein CSKR_107431 [Clonorchis sinensis]
MIVEISRYIFITQTTHNGPYDFRNVFAQRTSIRKYYHLQINLVFMEYSSEYLVTGVLQLNVHKGRFIFQLVRYSKYRTIFSWRKLLTRLLKTLRQPATGFALLEAVISRISNQLKHENIKLTYTRGSRLPYEPQEGRNRSWAVESLQQT